MRAFAFFENLKKLTNFISRAFRSRYYGFIYGHEYLRSDELMQISQLVGINNAAIVADFERQFAQLVGTGDAIAYAAARMGFYELMRLEGVGEGDEIILLGATCSVMVNAVLRAGATPIFADLDSDTFGSSSAEIEACISCRTRMIVAQHSFGIPCNIQSIVDLAKERGIFLLEDCALTLGSKINGLSVGNFGDAALFSTDHSKPINTITGGLIYTKNYNLAKRLRISQAACGELTTERQNALWRRLLLEAKYCVPTRYACMALINALNAVKKKLILSDEDFLADDFGTAQKSSYPYPAKLPAFLAAVGIIELNRWPKVSMDRAIALQLITQAIRNTSLSNYLPSAYKNPALDIIPLRIAFSLPSGNYIRNLISDFIDVDMTWFKSPIVATKEPLVKFGYCVGSCPVSERIGNGMVNLPCVYEIKDIIKMIADLEKALH